MFVRGTTFSEISKTVEKTTGKDLETIVVECTKKLEKLVLNNDKEMSVFWNNFKMFESENIAIAKCTLQEKKIRPKRIKTCSQEMIDKAEVNELLYQKDLEFFCRKCLKIVTLDSKAKIPIHVRTICHQDGLLSALWEFVETFRFLRSKMRKRATNSFRELSLRVHTTKTRQQFLDAFQEYSGIKDATVRQLERGLEALNVSIDKPSAFFCLCPYCDVKEVSEKHKKGLAEHQENVALTRKRFLKTLLDENNIVCVIDFAANIRSKRIEYEQKDFYKYVQWSLFNLTVLKTSSKEKPEKYFDVITYRGDGKDDNIKHNSAYVISALKGFLRIHFSRVKKTRISSFGQTTADH